MKKTRSKPKSPRAFTSMALLFQFLCSTGVTRAWLHRVLPGRPDNGRSAFRVLAFLAVLFLLAATSAGQVTSGEILGTIRDPSGAVVADARITVRNLETNATRDL